MQHKQHMFDYCTDQYGPKFISSLGHRQCDQKNITKCLLKLPENDFTRKMIDFDTITKIA